VLLSQRGEFLKQWVEFPRGQHDDAIDCVDLVVSNVLNEGGKPFLYVVKR
jgi:phage terminase large subunit-like protein